MELIIDNTRCDLLEGSIPKLEFMPLKVDSVEELRSGWSIQFTLPSTPTNNALMCYSATPHTEREFNHELHYAHLKCEGTTLLKGVVRLLKVEPKTPQACYLIEIRGGAPHWAKLASERRVKELQLESDLRLTPSDIVLSWSNDSPIKFLPVAYDSYLPTQSDSSSIIPLERMLSCDDYLPFLNIRAIIEKIFSDAGYTLKSKFLDSDLFNSLYMSGAYPKHNIDVQRERMDFYASRLADIESTANHLGRVYASTGVLVNSIGNIVDSFKPTNIDQDGEPTYNCFSNGGYLKLEDGELCFRPPSTINVGFHYTLCYNTSLEKDPRVQWPFGYGLSYTTFEYSDLKADSKASTSDESVTLSFNVTNTGSVAADEVAQIYLSPAEEGQNIRPIQLQGFARVSLQPGETKTVKVKLNTEQFGYYTNDGARQWNIAPGSFQIKVGASSADIRLTGTVTLNGKHVTKPLREYYFSETEVI